jgi:hypothetical protein
LRERELHDLFKILDSTIWKIGQFLETEQIHHFSWKRKLAHIKKCTKDLLEEIERF